MKVYRVEHRQTGEGPFFGPSNNSLRDIIANMMDTMVTSRRWPVSKFNDRVSDLDYFGVRNLVYLREWFHDEELLNLMIANDYHIVMYKVKSVKFEDGNQLTFRKERATKIKTLDIQILFNEILDDTQ